MDGKDCTCAACPKTRQIATQASAECFALVMSEPPYEECDGPLREDEFTEIILRAIACAREAEDK